MVIMSKNKNAIIGSYLWTPLIVFNGWYCKLCLLSDNWKKAILTVASPKFCLFKVNNSVVFITALNLGLAT